MSIEGLLYVFHAPSFNMFVIGESAVRMSTAAIWQHHRFYGLWTGVYSYSSCSTVVVPVTDSQGVGNAKVIGSVSSVIVFIHIVMYECMVNY